MRDIQKFQAVDGKEFLSKIDCENHEKLIFRLTHITSSLYPLPDGCDFLNGKGYLQYDIHYINNVKLKFLKLIEVTTEWNKLKEAVAAQRLNLYTFSILGRYLDDSDSVFYATYSRLFGNIDENGREWGQAYYKNNPDKAEQIQLNDIIYTIA